MVTFEETKKVLDTLPIGYYLGKGIKCSLDIGEMSYHNPKTEEIVIGYGMISDALGNTFDTADAETLEKAIRTVLYHEISHVILTPNNIFSCLGSYNLTKDVVNVFEDERIETILKCYYHLVDFKWFCKLVNHYTPHKPTSAFDMFYQIVRFDALDKDLVKEKNEIIKRNSQPVHKVKLYEYKLEIQAFWEKIQMLFEEEKEKEKESKTESEKTESESEESESEKSESEKTECSMPTESESEIESETESKESEEKESEETESEEDLKEWAEKIIKDSIKDTILYYESSVIQEKMNTIIKNALSKQARFQGGSDGWRGKADKKLIGKDYVRDTRTYRWFVSEDEKGSMSRFSKIKLNLFVDVSGSFCGSQRKINQIINSLLKIEKKTPALEVDVIKMGMTNEIAKKSNRLVNCDGGNKLTRDIIDIYKKVQSPLANNYNIVVFDGDAQSDIRGYYKDVHKDAFKAWNHPNCVIISDRSNQRYIEGRIEKGKVIYTTNYVDELEDNVLKTMGLLLR